jgi:hypothetical protein
MNQSDTKALESLRIFLADYPKVADIDVEPTGQGAAVKITASDKKGLPLYSSWGKDMTEAVSNMVRSILK